MNMLMETNTILQSNKVPYMPNDLKPANCTVLRRANLACE